MAGIVGVTLALSTPAFASDVNYQLFKDVEGQVLKYPYCSIFDTVNARVDDGVVELTGKVTMPFKRDAIGERVAKVAGVKAVRNRIDVLPVSRFDDELRVRIARAIYSNSNFYGYGSRVNPPIHVIVERGTVTLEGVVNNNVDRMIAQSIAAGFTSFKFTNDLKTVEEARQELEKL
jgi:hyperosmotically inducible protein